MINLLPAELKESIRYARRNTILRSWAGALIGCIVIILGIFGAGQLYLQQNIKNYESQVTQGKNALQIQKIDETQKNLEDLSSSLKLVIQVLQREILFSKLITQIGSALPNGAVLTNLSINKVQGGLDLTFNARNYQTATQVQLNLQDPNNKIFEKADLISIQCNDGTATSNFDAQYPCTVQLRTLFAKNNSFTFIPTGSTKK